MLLGFISKAQRQAEKEKFEEEIKKVEEDPVNDFIARYGGVQPSESSETSTTETASRADTGISKEDR